MKEVTAPHTGLLRLGLAVPQSLIFWERATSDLKTSDLAREAFEAHWFGDSTQARTRYLIGQLQRRFPFVVRQALRSELANLQKELICHWHLQLTDPLYRAYTGEFILSCWSGTTTSIDLESSVDWVREQPIAQNWQPATIRRLASGLLSAATDAGLCKGNSRTEKELRIPTVTEADMKYLALLLDQAECRDRLPYSLSVGRSEEQVA